MADDYEVQSSELLQETRVFALRRERATHPRRPEGTFFVLDAPDWVNVVALTDEAELVLVRQWRAGTRTQELEIPGGMVDPGEDPLHAAARELLEETGFAGEGARVIGVSAPNPAIMNNRCTTVLLEGCRRVAQPRGDSHEDIEVVVLPEAEVWGAVRSGELGHAIALSGLLHYRLVSAQGLTKSARSSSESRARRSSGSS